MDRVDRIKAPTLVICGSEDGMTPVKYAQHLASKIGGARLAIIEGATHLAFMEKPAVEEPAVEEPVVEEPATEQPATEEPAAPVTSPTTGLSWPLIGGIAVIGVLLLIIIVALLRRRAAYY